MATERARLKVGLLGRDDWQVGQNHEVDVCTCVWHKVGVFDMESNIDLHKSGQGRNHLPDETVGADVGRRESLADDELHNSQESRIKLKQSGQGAVSELRGGDGVVRGGVKRDWQWESSTRWSAVEWFLLAYLAGHHARLVGVK